MYRHRNNPRKKFQVAASQLPGGYRISGSSHWFVSRANRFLSTNAARGLSNHTIRAYAFDLICLARWLDVSGKHLKVLNCRHLLEFIAHQRQQQARPQSINRRLVTTDLFFQFCYEREIPNSRGVTRPAVHYARQVYDSSLGLLRIRRRGPNKIRVKVTRELVEPLTPIDVQHFFSHIKRYRDVAIATLMLLSGLRSCEVLALRIGDLELTERRIVIRGKGNKQRLLPLIDQTIDALENYLRLERPDNCRTNLLFVVLQGPRRMEPMSSAGLRNIFRYRRATLNLRQANPHRFRHTFGADMARSGVSLPVLQRMMGHANGQTTLKYINLCAEDVMNEYRLAMERIRGRYDRPAD